LTEDTHTYRTQVGNKQHADALSNAAL